ncbi:hypothetical protein [Streptomyces macrosporus]|uniref:Uncharacterized protein n=1 Tax=Streptomyces macrosporus TaxID=44032 RepID=A0ABN3J4A9_9ACTN
MSADLLREDFNAALAQFAAGLRGRLPGDFLSDPIVLIDSHRTYALDLIAEGTISPADARSSVWSLISRMVLMQGAADARGVSEDA